MNEEEYLNVNFYELETLNKIEFQKEKYILLDLDWTSTILWNKNHHNVPLEWMDWDSNSRLALLKACHALYYVYNSRSVAHSKEELIESYFADEYITEQMLNVAIWFKQLFPDWTVQIHDYFSVKSLISSSTDNYLTITEETDRVGLLNQRRSRLELNPGLISINNENY